MDFPPKPYLKGVSLAPAPEAERLEYPFNIPSVRHIGEIKFHPDVTFFVGENGSGKSTVLEALAMSLGYSAEGGTRNVRFKTTESVSKLHQGFKLIRSYRKPKEGYFLRAESFFNLATYMDDEIGGSFGYGVDSLHKVSHGESFMALLVHKLHGEGLYLFDEPEAALSPARQLAALIAIHHLVQKSSQFIIATHSPILLSYPGARILQFDGSGITEVKYEETEHYQLTRDFLNHYPKRLDQLLRGDA